MYIGSHTAADKFCEGGMSGVEFAFGSVIGIKHQWLRMLDPGVCMLVREAPEADVGYPRGERFAHEGPVYFDFACVVERMDVHFCNGNFQPERIVGFDHLSDYPWSWSNFGDVHL